jgi:threonine/homoserine/homoserine lactone efflux protein
VGGLTAGLPVRHHPERCWSSTWPLLPGRFYLAVLPQFLVPGADLGFLLGYALSHAALGMLHLTGPTLLLSRARRLLSRRAVRRGLDAVTGVLLLGSGARPALERS